MDRMSLRFVAKRPIIVLLSNSDLGQQKARPTMLSRIPTVPLSYNIARNNLPEFALLPLHSLHLQVEMRSVLLGGA